MYKRQPYSSALASTLSGGDYTLIQVVDGTITPAYAEWELAAAKVMYYVAFPALQFFLAILIVDTWQYFLHRAMHMNKWLYSEYILSDWRVIRAN